MNHQSKFQGGPRADGEGIIGSALCREMNGDKQTGQRVSSSRKSHCMTVYLGPQSSQPRKEVCVSPARLKAADIHARSCLWKGDT